MQKKQLTTQSPPIFQFQFGDYNVRVVMIDGAPWWIAADTCGVLEIKNPRSSLALLDADEKGVHTVDTPGGKQELTVINEPGLYTLILRSRKPEAKTFKRWVTHEVLPAIRKTGRYAVADSYPPMSLDPMTVIRAAEEAAATVLGPRASQAVAREFGARIGAPTKLLPVIPPYAQKIHQIKGPALPIRKEQDEKTGASIRARRKRLGLTVTELGEQAFPGRTRDASSGIVSRMERAVSLTKQNLCAVNAVLGDELPPTTKQRTTNLTVATSIIARFPFIPDLCEMGLYCDRNAQNEKERLMPARKFAEDVFEAWV